MAWKGLHLSKAARLSLAGGQCCVSQDEGEVRIAIEDLAYVVLDTPQATLSSALLSALMAAGVAIVITDDKHTPSGLALPFHRHHLQGGVARMQIGATDSLKRKIWQAIIRTKIVNQSKALTLCGHDNADTLKEIARHVEPGDPSNVEARAARYYWGRFFNAFVRDDPADRRNALLNYGYAVARAGVARALVAAGFLPAIGLKHDGAANAFNLADDIVEPFRPFIDLLAWKVFAGGDKAGELSLDDRRAMAGALNLNALVGEEKVTLLVAAEMAAASLARAIEQRDPRLISLPALIETP